MQLQGQAESRLLQKSVPFICSVQLANEDQRGKRQARLCTSGFSSLLPRHPSRPLPRQPPQCPRKGRGTVPSVIRWTDRREADEDEVR